MINISGSTCPASQRGSAAAVIHRRGLLVSNDAPNFSRAMLESRRCECLFMICQYGPLQKTVRLALSTESLSFLWSCPLHLSAGRDLDFIHRKAFTRLNTAAHTNSHTHLCGHTRVLSTHRHALRFWHPIRAKEQRDRSGLACLFDSRLSFGFFWVFFR